MKLIKILVLLFCIGFTQDSMQTDRPHPTELKPTLIAESIQDGVYSAPKVVTKTIFVDRVDTLQQTDTLVQIDTLQVKTHTETSLNNELQKHSFFLAIAILIFSVIESLIVAYSLKRGVPASALMKIVGTISIINASLFLITAGFSDTQIASVIGLFGTIVGFLIGKSQGTPKE